jgi:RpiR family transcriptional regulator, carbohydrate utilization regulator
MPEVLLRIRRGFAHLPPAEQRVARLVLDDPVTFARLPVGELARRARVSKPTVVRCCRSLGYDGLTDMKARLVQEAAKRG